MIHISYLYSIKQKGIWYPKFRESAEEVKEDLNALRESIGELHQVILENGEFRFIPVRDVKLFLEE